MIGGNTFYVSHPEEIIADNVAILGMFLGGYGMSCPLFGLIGTDIDEVTDSGFELLKVLGVIYFSSFPLRFSHRFSEKILSSCLKPGLLKRMFEEAE